MELVYTPVIGIARTIFLVQGLKFSVTGSEHIPRRGGAVIAVNHISYLDYMYAGLAARPSNRVIRFMAKEVVFRHPASAFLMKGMRHIPVDRESGASSFQAAVAALRSGELVGVFPEATISRSFELKGFKTGAVRMAQDAGVPIVPVVVWGSQRLWTKGHPKQLRRPGLRILVEVGEPLPVPAGADVATASDELKSRMSVILHRLQEAYEPLPDDERAFLPARLGGSAPTLAQAEEMDRAEVAARRARRERQQATQDGDSASPATDEDGGPPRPTGSES